MIGPDLAAPGGMSAVATSYRDAGMFERERVQYVSTYCSPGIATQLKVMVSATRTCLTLFVLRRVRLLHAHSASRGSFWRKSFFCLIAEAFGVPYILHIHSGEFPVFYSQECSSLAQWWVRRVLRLAAAVVLLTPRLHVIFEAIEPAARFRVLPNPVRVPPLGKDQRSQRTRVLFLGRMRQKKGVFDLVAATALVQRDVPGVECVLAGDGDLDAVREAARRCGLEGRVTLPGWVAGKEKDETLARADVFVLPSYFEGLPVGVLEAMAHGVPIVATNVGGIPDVVSHGVHALLVEPGDVEALAKAIASLLMNRGMADRLRHNAYERAKSVYSEETVMSQLESIYLEVDAAHRRRGPE
jgi:glycosyltransferase involved in cell wall biosynthesis